MTREIPVVSPVGRGVREPRSPEALGATPLGSGCQPSASAACASSRSGIPSAEFPQYGGRYASESVWQDLDELRHKLRLVISHASGGALSEPGDIDRSINDICVEISRHKNEVWEHAQRVALRDASAMSPGTVETQSGSGPKDGQRDGFSRDARMDPQS